MRDSSLCEVDKSGDYSTTAGECLYEDSAYSTDVGKWVCDVAWPWIGRKIGWCLGKAILGLLFGLGFWFAQYITGNVVIYLSF